MAKGYDYRSIDADLVLGPNKTLEKDLKNQNKVDEETVKEFKKRLKQKSKKEKICRQWAKDIQEKQTEG